MASIGSLTADLRLQSAAFIRDLSKAQAAVAKNTKAMARSMDAVHAATNRISAALVGLISVKAIKKVIGFRDEIVKLASTMEGDLGNAARSFIKSSEEFENAFKLGAAAGFLEEYTGKLLNTEEQLKEITEAGRTLGKVLAQSFQTVTKSVKLLMGPVGELQAAIEFFQTHGAREGINRTLGWLANSGVPQMSTHAKGMQGGGADDQNPFNPDPELLNTYSTEMEKAALATEEFWNATTKATEWGKELQDMFREGARVFEDTRTPMEEYANTIERLSALQKAGAIDAETYARAHTMAAATAVAPWLNVAETVGGALATLFKENKAVAIAQAVINTAQGVTAALAQYPPPLSFAMAAAQAAAGAAQIATIVQTQPGGSKSAAFKGGKGGGSVSAGKASRGTSTTQQQSVNITIEGESFGPDHFKRLVAGLNGVIADGAVLRVS